MSSGLISKAQWNPRRVRFLSLGVAVGVGICILVFPLLFQMVEFIPPKVDFADPHAIAGVGIAKTPLSFTVSDPGSGVRDIIVEVITNKKNATTAIELLTVIQGDGAFTVPVTVDPKKYAQFAREGKLQLRITATDTSWWKNKVEFNVPLLVDYDAPTLSIVQGDTDERAETSSMIFFRVSDENLERSGIRVDGREFLADAAWSADKRFTDTDLRIVLFPLPQKSEHAEVFARDFVGNEVVEPLTVPLRVVTSHNRHEVLTDKFLAQKVRVIADAALPLFQERGSISHEEYQQAFLSQNLDEQGIAQFKLLQNNLRKLNDEELARSMSERKYGTGFTDHFVLPRGEQSVLFNDSISFERIGKVILKDTSEGVVFTTPQGAEQIVAANDGTVIFSAPLGVYGNAVIIDHGLGVTTFYANLRVVSVKRGDFIERGRAIGFSGESGLCMAPQLYFEMRIQGVPIDPVEWSNPGVFHKRFTLRIEALLTKLGLLVVRPLDWGFKNKKVSSSK